jgi:hypothetical protein
MSNEAVDLFNDFAINEAAAQDGVWVPYRGDVEFLIARASNKHFRKQAQAVFKRHERLIQSGGPAAEAKSRELMIDLMSKTILLNWKGTVMFQGQPLEYSVENAKKILELDGLREWVDAQSKDEAQYKAVKDEENEKN